MVSQFLKRALCSVIDLIARTKNQIVKKRVDQEKMIEKMLSSVANHFSIKTLLALDYLLAFSAICIN